jgi:hypothetical protein
MCQNTPNKACTGRLGRCAFFGSYSELWQFSASEPFSREPPVTQAVGQPSCGGKGLLKNDKQQFLI